MNSPLKDKTTNNILGALKCITTYNVQTTLQTDKRIEFNTSIMKKT